MLQQVRDGLSFLRGLCSRDVFGPLKASDYVAESLDEVRTLFHSDWPILTNGQPIYPLVNSIFRLSDSPQGWLYWLVVYFVKPIVHFTVGDIVNRGILHAIEWLTSERRIAYYFYLLREAMWPGGRWAPDVPPLTPQQSEERKERLVAKLDEFLGTIGQLLN